VAALWSACARRCLAWLDAGGLARRDAVLLLPFSALLAPARAAFAACGGWQPRIETAITLAASLGPPPSTLPEACSGHPVIDGLQASALLRRFSWTERWRRDDPGGLDRLVARFVDAAQALRSAALTQPPARREAWWQAVRESLPGPGGPAALEALLLRSALEWAALDARADTDRLFSHRPSAWMALELGGRDALSDAVLAAATVPVLRVLADPDAADPFALDPALVDPALDPAPAPQGPGAATPAEPQVQRWLCDGFEAEAQAAAACVIDALNAGAVPVALVALDRELVRRVRALLARQAVPLVDETGWKLSTTLAATRIGNLLAAAQAAAPWARTMAEREHPPEDGAPQDDPAASGGAPKAAPGARAGRGRERAPEHGVADTPDDVPPAARDAWLDWLKQWPPARPSALRALEARWRGQRLAARAEAASRSLLLRAQQHLARHLIGARAPTHSRPTEAAADERLLGDWLAALDRTLSADGTRAWLAADEAGRQVLAALHLDGPDNAAFRHSAAGTPMQLADFAAWIGHTLEAATYLPPADAGAELVLTPLSRAIGRPFATVVLAGTDAQRLGAVETPPGLISDTLAARWGLPDARQRRERQRLALAQLLRSPALHLLRRHRDGEEPLADSPDVEWLLLRRAQAGAPPWPCQRWVAATQVLPLTPQAPPRPVAAQALPARLSASQLEALRACPYRFFARAVLRLSEPDEVDAPLAQRDYGTWLHEVLHRFHHERAAAALAGPAGTEDDAARLAAAADAVTTLQRRDPAALMPFRAAFDALAPAYLRWLQQREAAGWQWHTGEVDVLARFEALAAVGGPTLRGRLDRVDRFAGPQGGQGASVGALEVLDYKTGNPDALKQRVRQPLEDTQLAFYAALLLGSDSGAMAADAGVRAAYLAMDGTNAPVSIEHEAVETSARTLVQALAGEWQRMQAGAPLPALGEGAVCTHCEARGLCRRDHWSTP
jgi:ATP-dependent helicase/nuclease subunit B